MSATERRKGATAELEVVRLVKAAGWKNAARTHDGRAQRGRGDIANGPPGVHIEVKRHERLNVPKALRQIEADAHPLDLPVLVHRPRCRHGFNADDEWMATIPLDELLALLKLKEST